MIRTISQKQFPFSEFKTPFEATLDENNHWVVMSQLCRGLMVVTVDFRHHWSLFFIELIYRLKLLYLNTSQTRHFNDGADIGGFQESCRLKLN